MTTTPQKPFAKPSEIVVALFIVAIGAAILWREFRIAAELDSLRATLARSAAPPTEQPTTTDNTSRAFPTWERDLATIKAHVTELERQQERTTNLLNQAISELNRLNVATEKAASHPWGPEQVLGEPDTMAAGDHPTAWAPAQQDAGPEWLQVGYDHAVEIAQVRVRETANPGALTHVTAVLDDGREVGIWQGVEQAGPAPYDSAFDAPRGIVARAVRIYLDTSRTAGWEEIDAVELIGTDGSRQWATSATASSSYSQRRATSTR
jgi:hypothetical protein